MIDYIYKHNIFQFCYKNGDHILSLDNTVLIDQIESNLNFRQTSPISLRGDRKKIKMTKRRKSAEGMNKNSIKDKANYSLKYKLQFIEELFDKKVHGTSLTNHEIKLLSIKK